VLAALMGPSKAPRRLLLQAGLEAVSSERALFQQGHLRPPGTDFSSGDVNAHSGTQNLEVALP